MGDMARVSYCWVGLVVGEGLCIFSTGLGINAMSIEPLCALVGGSWETRIFRKVCAATNIAAINFTATEFTAYRP
jgi:hypothetical protein